MNTVQGHISDIQVSESLSMVSIEIQKGIVWKTIVVETPETASYLQQGNTITLLFKETELIIAKEDCSISIENKVEGTITDIEKGILLSKLTIDTDIGNLVAILATETMVQLNLVENQRVVAMIKMNEIMVSS